MDDNLRIWRNFKIGNLLDLIMLDTRHYDRSITDLYLNRGYIKKIADDIGRSMMGPRQEHWFYDNLKSSAKRQATWRVIGSQTGTHTLHPQKIKKLKKIRGFLILIHSCQFSPAWMSLDQPASA